jgi:hypothetical protein
MNHFSVPLFWLAVPFLVGLVSASGAEPPELSFRQDGEDLVVTTQIRINGSEHVLLTNSFRTEKIFTLSYCVIQNSDRMVRHQKTLDIEWRLKKHRKGQEEYQVKDQYLGLDTAEFERLGDQVRNLIGEDALHSAHEPATPSEATAERVKVVRQMYEKLHCEILGFAEPAKKVVEALALTDGGTMVLVLQDAKDNKLSIRFDGKLASKTRGSIFLEGGRLPPRSPEESAVYGLLLRFAANPPDQTPNADVEAVKGFLFVLDERFAGAMPFTDKGADK